MYFVRFNYLEWGLDPVLVHIKRSREMRIKSGRF